MALTIPDFEAYLQSLGVGAANDSGTRYIEDAQGERIRLSQGQLDEMMGNDLTGYQQAQITQQGYVPLEPLQDTSWFNQNYGTNFSGGEDYARWLYGGGQVETGPDGKQYFKTPNGTTSYVNQPLKYIAPDDPLGSLVKMGIIGLATAGLGGYLPGVEGIFGAGAGAGAATGAAEGALALGAEAAPAFVGGASGAGVAGGALGAIPAGLSTAELAALGIGGTGAAAGASGAFNFADYITNGTLPGGGSNAIPAIPGMGNGVGLLEAAQAGLNSGATTALSRFLNGDASTSDYLGLLGTLGKTAGGLYASDQMSDSYNQLAQQYLGMGQPYRDKLAATYDPNWSFADTPDMQRSSQAAMDQASRALSAKFGNPADSSTAIGELLKYGIDNNLSKSFDYRNQLGAFGGLGAAPISAASTAGLLGTKAERGIFESLGSGLEDLTNPLSQIKGLLGGYKLNPGTSF